ncbi:guanitoxin biosynthesis heme-dependent pre-guanitoxin N-hydroxylase GntA [Candidatus Uabimicrobium sp. HlEnr_7]|uniref:guanitoxin biosynthesis heme-dependent pre-guanitoxin N-hydroxylase GntA n=1 Tax=Candidatus Uabimicrobium helgolandensis TaxID=3095367 RepID=UPI0035569F86
MHRANFLDTSMFLQNPFNNKAAIEYSNYNGFDGNQLVNISNKTCPKTQQVHNEFRSFILNSNFSCILGKAAIQKKAYRFGFYPDMKSENCLQGIARDLYNFVIERPVFEESFSTFVASFSLPQIKNEGNFEASMWDLLYRLQILDQQFHSYDPAVSSAPQDDNYAYSFAGLAFFIVGLHPKSSRQTRTFHHPTIVFNPHIQFRNLRKTQKFLKYQSIIRERELNLQGNINPNLADFGEESEARQYSGRHVEKNWTCPLHSNNNPDKN